MLFDSEMGMDRVWAFLRAFLWGGPAIAGALELCLEDGKSIRVACVNGHFHVEGNAELTYEIVLDRLGIRVGANRLGVVERVGIAEDGMERCRLRPELSGAVSEFIGEVLMSPCLGRGCEVCAPMWLIDLGLRLCMGEKVLFVEPGELWRPTVEALSRREVQAIVAIPAARAA
jgi:hypothetical protein